MAHMKTTIDVQDALLERSKRAALKEGITLRAIVEEGLRLALSARQRRARPDFRMITFNGDGLTDDFRSAGWDRVRDEIYSDRG